MVLKDERKPNLKVLESGVSECLESGIHRHESGIQSLESGIHGAESGIQDSLGFLYLGRDVLTKQVKIPLRSRFKFLKTHLEFRPSFFVLTNRVLNLEN